MMHPAVFGHEGSGVVIATGDAVTGVAVGDHVVLSSDSCGRCGRCREGRAYYCDGWAKLNLGGPGFPDHPPILDMANLPVHSGWFGQSSFATYAVARETNVVRVRKDVPLDIPGPLGCGFLTGPGAVLNAFKIQPGQSLVVYGAGAVGLAAVMAARICNASSVVVIDPVESPARSRPQTRRTRGP